MVPEIQKIKVIKIKVMKNYLNLIEEKKFEILEELRDAAEATLMTYEEEGEDITDMEVGDIAWNFVDDASYEYTEALMFVLDIDDEDVIEEILENEGEVQDILFGENNVEMLNEVFGYQK